MPERLPSKLDDWKPYDAFDLDGRYRVHLLADPALWSAFQAVYEALGLEFGSAFDAALRAWIEARCAERPELAEVVRQAGDVPASALPLLPECREPGEG